MTEPQPFSREHRKSERRRIARLSRLPFLYDFSLRGRTQSLLALLAQGALVVALVLVPAKLLTGRWLPTGIALAVLAAGFAVQWASRYLNAQAGRR